MSQCEVCYQALLQSPRLCCECGESIAPGHTYRYRDAKGVCEPVHARCFNGNSSRGTSTSSEEGRLL